LNVAKKQKPVFVEPERFDKRCIGSAFSDDKAKEAPT